MHEGILNIVDISTSAYKCRVKLRKHHEVSLMLKQKIKTYDDKLYRTWIKNEQHLTSNILT